MEKGMEIYGIPRISTANHNWQTFHIILPWKSTENKINETSIPWKLWNLIEIAVESWTLSFLEMENSMENILVIF